MWTCVSAHAETGPQGMHCLQLPLSWAVYNVAIFSLVMNCTCGCDHDRLEATPSLLMGTSHRCSDGAYTAVCRGPLDTVQLDQLVLCTISLQRAALSSIVSKAANGVIATVSMSASMATRLAAGIYSRHMHAC